MTDLPTSAPEKWDTIAEKVKRARGDWVMVLETPEGHRGQNHKVKEALKRRGITAEVHSRLGRNTEDRPYEGWRTWCRELKL